MGRDREEYYQDLRNYERAVVKRDNTITEQRNIITEQENTIADQALHMTQLGQLYEKEKIEYMTFKSDIIKLKV